MEVTPSGEAGHWVVRTQAVQAGTPVPGAVQLAQPATGAWPPEIVGDVILVVLSASWSGRDL